MQGKESRSCYGRVKTTCRWRLGTPIPCLYFSWPIALKPMNEQNRKPPFSKTKKEVHLFSLWKEENPSPTLEQSSSPSSPDQLNSGDMMHTFAGRDQIYPPSRHGQEEYYIAATDNKQKRRRTKRYRHKTKKVTEFFGSLKLLKQLTRALFSMCFFSSAVRSSHTCCEVLCLENQGAAKELKRRQANSHETLHWRSCSFELSSRNSKYHYQKHAQRLNIELFR